MTNGKSRVGCVVRTDVAFMSKDESHRLRAFVMRVGRKHAPKLLGIGEGTLDEARCDGARLLKSTKAKLLEALEREERKAS